MIVETQAFVQAMKERGMGPAIIEMFCRLYEQYRSGQTGKIPWAAVSQPKVP